MRCSLDRNRHLNHVRIFGSSAFMHIPKSDRKKWEQKSRELIIVGYDEDKKSYRLMDQTDTQSLLLT